VDSSSFNQSTIQFASGMLKRGILFANANMYQACPKSWPSCTAQEPQKKIVSGSRILRT
jgi:hypothetical protein